MQPQQSSTQLPVEAPANQPSVTGQVYTPGPTPDQLNSPVPASFQPKPRSRRGLIIKIGVGLIVLLSALVAYILVFYLPNTPTNVWRRGLASVGVGLETALNTSMESPKSNTNFIGKLNVSSPFEITADMHGNYDIEDGSGKLELDVTYGGHQPSAEVIYTTPEGSTYPDIYFMLDQIQPMLADYLGQSQEATEMAAMLEGTWWKVNPGDYISSKAPEERVEPSLSQADYEKLLRAWLDAANEYVFTANTDQMVLEPTEVLEKEEYEGVMSQKYRVTVNSANLEAFVRRLRDNTEATGLREKLGYSKPLNEDLTDEDIQKAVAETTEELSKGTELYAWVDLDLKVLRNVRMVSTEPADSQTYDLSILLQPGSSKIPIRYRLEDNNDQNPVVYNATLTLDTEASNILFEFNAQSTPGDESTAAIAADLSLELIGTDDHPEHEIPQNARDIREIFGAYTNEGTLDQDPNPLMEL